MSATVSLSLDEIHDLALSALLSAGCDEPNADAVATNMTAAERDGAVSHGLYRLPGHLTSLRSGKVNGTAQPVVEEILPAALRLHGDRGFAPLAHRIGIPPLVDAARACWVAVLLIRDSFHFAALWPEVEAVASHDLAAFACTAHTPFVAPFGGRTPLFSTNPIAFAYPRPGRTPYVFDMATSAMAHGEIGVAAREGRDVPLGVGLDADGAPTTRPAEILDGGVLLPFGGYKGSAIATMVELLAAGLVGDNFSYEAVAQDNRDGGPAIGGQMIIAFSPRLLAGPDWADHSEAFLAELEAIDGVRLPGQRRFDNRNSGDRREVNAELVERLRSGV